MTNEQIIDRITAIVTQYGSEFYSMDMISQDRHGTEYFELLYQHLMIILGDIDD